MQFVKDIIEVIIHIDKHLDIVIQAFGGWSYFLFFVIIFAETGLVVTPFLPGDSLLFVVGAFAAKGYFNLTWLFIILAAAATIGDTVNYAFGKFFGEQLLQKGSHRFFKKEYVERTHKFYEKYGGKTIILARFVPIVRTFAPFVAGIGKMSYYKFAIYNVSGALLWVGMFVFGGYYFGNIPFIKDNFLVVILTVMLVSILPFVTEFWKYHRARKKLQLIAGIADNQANIGLPEESTSSSGIP